MVLGSRAWPACLGSGVLPAEPSSLPDSSFHFQISAWIIFFYLVVQTLPGFLKLVRSPAAGLVFNSVLAALVFSPETLLTCNPFRVHYLFFKHLEVSMHLALISSVNLLCSETALCSLF